MRQRPSWRLLFIPGALCALAVSTYAREIPKSSIYGPLRKPADTVDRAHGPMDRGRLRHTVQNFGFLVGPGFNEILPSVEFDGRGWVPEMGVMVGVPEGEWNPPGVRGPSVSESWFTQDVSENDIDWEATDGSWGFFHSGKLFSDDRPPLMAKSDDPGTWPPGYFDEDGNWVETGVPTWPGRWAIDPETGDTLVGTFTSDLDIFFSFSDNHADGTTADWRDRERFSIGRSQDVLPDNGFPLNIQVNMMGFSYAQQFAEDFIFFEGKIINKSEWNYTGVWVGIYIDFDAYHYPGGTRSNDDDWMAFAKDSVMIADKGPVTVNMAYGWDVDGLSVDQPAEEYVGVQFFKLPTDPETEEELGLRGWHWFTWFNRPGCGTPGAGRSCGGGEGGVANIWPNQEEIQYKLMAGDTTGIISDPNIEAAYFHPDADDPDFDPHFDDPLLVQEKFPEGLDCVFIMSSGPFEWPAGDTLDFSLGIVMGENKDDLFENAKVAQQMFDNNFLGASAPDAPNLVALPGDRKVTLYWDDVA